MFSKVSFLFDALIFSLKINCRFASNEIGFSWWWIDCNWFVIIKNFGLIWIFMVWSNFDNSTLIWCCLLHWCCGHNCWSCACYYLVESNELKIVDFESPKCLMKFLRAFCQVIVLIPHQVSHYVGIKQFHSQQAVFSAWMCKFLSKTFDVGIKCSTLVWAVRWSFKM